MGGKDKYKIVEANCESPEASAGCISRIFFFWVLDFARRAIDQIDKNDFTLDWLATDAPVPQLETPQPNIDRVKKYWDREVASKGNDANLFTVLCKMMSGILATCLTIVSISTLTNMCGTVWNYVLVKAISGEYPVSIGYLAAALKTFAAMANSTMLQQNQHLLSREGRRIWLGLTGHIYSKPANLDSQSWGDLTEGELCNMLAVDSQQVIQGSMFFGMFAASPLYLCIPLFLLPYFLGWPFAAGAVFYVMSMIYSNSVALKNRDLQREKMEHADNRMSVTNEIFQGIRTVKLNGWEEVMEERVLEIRDKEMKALRKIFVWQAWQSCVTGAVPVYAQVVTFMLYLKFKGMLGPAEIFVCVGLFNFMQLGISFIPTLLRMVRELGVSMARIKRLLIMPDDRVVGNDGGFAAGTVQCVDADFCWPQKVDASLAASNPFLKKGIEKGKKGSDKGGEKSDKGKDKEGKEGKDKDKKGKDSDGKGKDGDQDGKGGDGKGKSKDKKSSGKGEGKDKMKGTTELIKKLDLAPPTLKGVSLDVSPGEMVAICGRVGCGKSTWAGGLAGLVTKSGGSCHVSGHVAYVTQNPQILNNTIQENILFGSEMEWERYNVVIDACSLRSDLKQFVAGDKTEIGERGITISGGQKQRIAIARACYSHAHVIIFDDPLSAMDAHVGKEVFDACFIKLLAGRTRVFFTNQLQFCTDVEKIYMLEDGKVTEAGTYAELTTKDPKGPFGILLESVCGQDDDTTYEAPIKDDKEEAETDTKPPPPEEDLDGPEGEMMSREFKSGGRIGMEDFLVVTRAANSTGLGVAWIVSSLVFMPASAYCVSLCLALWSNATISAPPGVEVDDTFYTVLYIGCAVWVAILSGINAMLRVEFFHKSSRELHRAMLYATLRQSMLWFDTTPTGRLLNRFGGDVMSLDMFLPMLAGMWSRSFGTVMMIIVAAGITCPPVLIFSLGLLYLSVQIFRYYGCVTLELQRLQMLAMTPLLASQAGFLNALDSIQCYNRVDVFLGRFYKMQTQFILTTYWSFCLDRCLQVTVTALGVSFFIGITSSLLLLLASYETIVSAYVNAGSAAVCLTFTTTLAAMCPSAIFMTAKMETMIGRCQRLAEWKDLPIEGSNQAVVKPLPENWPQSGLLRLENVEMRYQEKLPLALKGVSLDVRSGEKVGIVGRTGSGKSSMVLTCFRMVECAGGGIFIDYQNIAELPLSAFRQRIGVMPQDSWLISGTVRSNLDLKNQHTDEELWEVIKQARLENVAREWEQGLEHEVYEKGQNLSTGTCQLLCLARVLLKRPKILFLDEATASVDMETDKLLQETIRSEGVLPKDCSIITVAHRLHTVIDYDKVIVLSFGKIEEVGSPHELLQNESGMLYQFVQDTGEASAKELTRRAAAAHAQRSSTTEA